MINHPRLEDSFGGKRCVFFFVCALYFEMDFVTQTKKIKSFKMDFNPQSQRLVLRWACWNTT